MTSEEDSEDVDARYKYPPTYYGVEHAAGMEDEDAD